MKLNVYKNSDFLEEFEFSNFFNIGESLFIGKSADCDITLDHPSLSREHCELYYDATGVELRPIADDHDIKVNGDLISGNHKLAKGDKITLHDYTINVIDLPAVGDNTSELSDDIFEEVELGGIEGELTREIDLNEHQTNILREESFQGEQEVFDDAENSLGSIDKENTNDNNEWGTFSDSSEPLQDEASIDRTAPVAQGNQVKPLDEFTAEHTRIISDFIKFVLKIKSEYSILSEYVLEKTETTLGRDNKNDLIIEDPQISSQHAKFVIENGKCYVIDLKSNNGVYVNDEIIKGKVEIVPGDQIIVGESFLNIEIYSQQISEESESLMPIDSDDPDLISQDGIELGESEETDDTLNKGGLSQFIASLKANPKKRTLYVAILAALFLLFLFDDDPATTVPDAPKEAVSQPPADLKIKQETEIEDVPKFSEKELEYMESHYAIAKALINDGDFVQALKEIDLVKSVDPQYKQIEDLAVIAKEGLAKIEENERKKREQEERERRRIQIKEIEDKFKQALRDDKLTLAGSYINQISEIDPEYRQLFAFREELDELLRLKEEEALEKARKEAERKRMVDLLGPGKSLFLQKKWYEATLKLEEFLGEKGIDEDLLQEAQKMLEEAQNNIAMEIAPIIEQARSYKASQDYKSAYENYLQILKIDGGNDEAHREIRELKEDLEMRARRVFREAMVSESLSLFREAKAKYSEVLQIAPSDSDYFLRAKEKLRDFSWGIDES